jgi:ABC-2 type transport system ATP-binding protein
VALGTPAALKRDLLGPPIWQVQLASPLGQPWPNLNGHLQVLSSDDLSLRYSTESPELANPMLLNRLHDIGASVLTLSEKPRGLEDVYLKLVED